MLSDFLTWWIGQLAEAVPERWRRYRPSGGDSLVVAPIGMLLRSVEAAQISLRHRGRETPLGRFQFGSERPADLPLMGKTRVVLQLTEADVLSKTLTLPLSAEAHLNQALAFEMDRETPFSVDKIFWNYRIARRDRQRGQLTVRLFLIPRAKLAALLGKLADAGMPPQRAEIAAGPDRGCHLPLADEDGRDHDTTGRKLIRWVAIACCVGLALATILMPFLYHNFELAGLDQRIESGRRAAAEAERLREEIDRLSGMVRLVEKERSKEGHPLATLALLTRLLPHDTYLVEFHQRQHKVILGGRSAEASRLIAGLAAGDQFRNPEFGAPVTLIEATKSEGFVITAEVGR
jgi:general secretion pathway protein L